MDPVQNPTIFLPDIISSEQHIFSNAYFVSVIFDLFILYGIVHISKENTGIHLRNAYILIAG